MACTRQTAKKTTDSSAKRVELAWHKHVPASALVAPALNPCMRRSKSSTDIQTEEGSGSVTSQTASVLFVHGASTSPPDKLHKVNVPHVHFTCVVCHWKKACNTFHPYTGFTVNGISVLNSFLRVNGQFETAAMAAVLTPPALLVHFRLRSIRHLAHFKMVEDHLREYYENDRLCVLDALEVFDTFYSDPDRGDLWLGLNEQEEICTAPLKDWLELLLEPFQGILAGSMLFFLACGGVVRKPNTFQDLKDSLSGFKIANALAFDANHLSPIITADLLMKITKSVVIHGFRFVQALEYGLQECITLGRHTGIVHFADTVVTKYLWTNRKSQPWGQPIALQCPQCGILEPWVSVYVPQIPAYRFQCRNKDCGKRGETKKEVYAFQISRPPNYEMLNGASGSGWMKVVL
ncbi:hypothetical protein EV363DRAFT_1443744 [Boletus edulis]|nr:hypothetical protein EV363DRAFT_1443744 [Boletus edulis]